MNQIKKKKRKFRPTVIPRYLPGQVKTEVLRSDLKMYNKLRKKVFYVKSKVDTKPPPMNPYNFISSNKLISDAWKLHEIDKRNKQLLKKINLINRHGGRVDTFNPLAYSRQSKWRAHELRMHEIVKENRQIYIAILSVHSDYSLKKMNTFWKFILNKLENVCKMPFTIMQHITLDQSLRSQPSISGGLEATSERPLCFLEFEIKDVMYLGKVVFQLYYDFVPVTVQNFLSLCKGDNGLTYNGSPVHNIVRNQCIEMGDITKGNGKGGMSIYGKTFPEENFVLKHTRGDTILVKLKNCHAPTKNVLGRKLKPIFFNISELNKSQLGVLSMIRIGKNENNSQFCITLDKVEKFDCRRVVFGKSIKGAETLIKIQDLGRKVGRPSSNVIISNCGECIKRCFK